MELRIHLKKIIIFSLYLGTLAESPIPLPHLEISETSYKPGGHSSVDGYCQTIELGRV